MLTAERGPRPPRRPPRLTEIVASKIGSYWCNPSEADCWANMSGHVTRAEWVHARLWTSLLMRVHEEKLIVSNLYHRNEEFSATLKMKVMDRKRAQWCDIWERKWFIWTTLQESVTLLIKSFENYEPKHLHILNQVHTLPRANGRRLYDESKRILTFCIHELTGATCENSYECLEWIGRRGTVHTVVVAIKVDPRVVSILLIHLECELSNFTTKRAANIRTHRMLVSPQTPNFDDDSIMNESELVFFSNIYYFVSIQIEIIILSLWLESSRV